MADTWTPKSGGSAMVNHAYVPPARQTGRPGGGTGKLS